MKRTTLIIVMIISILLVTLYTITSTYSVIIEVIEKDGVNEIINNITVRDLLTNDDGTYNETYYDLKGELSPTEEEANILMDSPSINEALQTLLKRLKRQF